MDVVRSWPPVTRTLVLASLVTSLGVYGGVLPFAPLIFLPYKLFALPPQIWRLVTAFLITGPKLSIIFDPYFLYIYGSQLESNNSRFSEHGAFFMYIVFNGLVITALANYFLGAIVFLDALLMAIVYTYAQDNANSMTHFLIINIQAKFLPYLMILITWIVRGPGDAMLQATGILSAHLYDFLTRIWPTFGGGRNYIVTPTIVKEWFGGGPRPAPRVRDYGVAYGAPGQARSTGSSWTSTRGPGHRLGGD